MLNAIGQHFGIIFVYLFLKHLYGSYIDILLYSEIQKCWTVFFFFFFTF